MLRNVDLMRDVRICFIFIYIYYIIYIYTHTITHTLRERERGRESTHAVNYENNKLVFHTSIGSENIIWSCINLSTLQINCF